MSSSIASSTATPCRGASSSAAGASASHRAATVRAACLGKQGGGPGRVARMRARFETAESRPLSNRRFSTLVSRSLGSDASSSSTALSPPPFPAPPPPTSSHASSSSAAASSSSSRPPSMMAPLPPYVAKAGDEGGEHYHALFAAYHAGDVPQQITSLRRLSTLSLEEGHHLEAAHLLNGAISIAPRGDRERLLRDLEGIEADFLRKKFGVEPNRGHVGSIARNRETLYRTRVLAKERMERGDPANEVQTFLTGAYKGLLCTLIQESIALLPERLRPKEGSWAVGGLGSMSRGEMCRNSDLEYFFLTSRASQEENLEKLRALNELLVLRMTNMGETEYKAIRGTRETPAKSFTPTGFCVDIGGLYPGGKEHLYELIGTPGKLAGMVTEAWLLQNSSEIIVANALATSCFVMGNPRLIGEYKKLVRSHLSKPLAGSSSAKSAPSLLRQKRALDLMEGYVHEFKPRLDMDKVKLRGFNVKQELYRLIQTVISGLALYHGLKERDTLERIDKLRDKGVFSPEGASRLKEVFLKVIDLRNKTYFFYEDEEEVLYNPKGVDDPVAAGRYLITHEILEMLTGIYQTLGPLREQAKAFRDDRKAFASSSFCDAAIGGYDSRHRDELRYHDAAKYAQALVALRPDELAARWNLGVSLLEVGKMETALESLHEQLQQFEELYKREAHPDIAATLRAIGLAYCELCKYDLAEKHLQASLAMKRKLYPEHHLEIVLALNGLGVAYVERGNMEEGIKHYKAAVDILEAPDFPTDGASQAALANIFNNLGNVFEIGGEYPEAEGYLKRALEIHSKLYPDPKKPHPSLAGTWMNLGHVYFHSQRPKQAAHCHQISLEMSRKIYGRKPHPDLALALMSLGCSQLNAGEIRPAIASLKKSISLYEKMGGECSPMSRARALMNLGIAYCSIEGGLSEGIKQYNKSLAICTEVCKGRPHPYIADILFNLGVAYYEQSSPDFSRGEREYNAEQIEKAREVLQGSLDQQIELYGGAARADTSDCMSNLGRVLSSLGRREEAVPLYQKAMEMKEKLYGGKPHPEIADCLFSLGLACDQLGRAEEAVQYYQRSYAMFIATLGRTCYQAPAIIKLHNALLHSEAGKALREAGVEPIADQQLFLRAALGYSLDGPSIVRPNIKIE